MDNPSNHLNLSQENKLKKINQKSEFGMQYEA